MLFKMADPQQDVAAISFKNEEQVSFSLWNIKSANQIRSFKGTPCGCHCLSKAGKDFFVTSQEDKQVINVWEWRKEQLHMRIVCPAKITAIACSPDGNYCIVAHLDKIYIWQMATGNLMRVLSRHYQNVTCLKFTDNGSHFVSGGDDNLVIVWSFSGVISGTNDMQNGQHQQKPLHTWSHHSLPVKDIHISTGGIRCRVASCSLDQTCKLYDMASGQLLCSFLFETGISSVAMDMAESFLFVGSITGKIHVINLIMVGTKKELHVNENETDGRFHGHRKEITALAVDSSGETLLSGSADNTARFWHIGSGQCIKQIQCKGKITNAMIIRCPGDLGNRASSQVLSSVSNFKRHLFDPFHDAIDLEGAENNGSLVPVVLKDIEKGFLNCCTANVMDLNRTRENDVIFKIIQEKQAEQAKQGGMDHKDVESMDRDELINRVAHLEQLTRTLYEVSGKKILHEVVKSVNS